VAGIKAGLNGMVMGFKPSGEKSLDAEKFNRIMRSSFGSEASENLLKNILL